MLGILSALENICNCKKDDRTFNILCGNKNTTQIALSDYEEKEYSGKKNYFCSNLDNKKIGKRSWYPVCHWIYVWQKKQSDECLGEQRKDNAQEKIENQINEREDAIIP